MCELLYLNNAKRLPEIYYYIQLTELTAFLCE